MKVEEKQTGEKIPTVQEQVAFIKGQLPLKRLQVEMQELNMRFIEAKVRELEAISKLQQFENEQNKMRAEKERLMMENIVKHTITQEDMDLNPELVEAGIKVGQEIGIPKEIYKSLNLANKAKDESQEEVKAKMEVVQD